MKKVKYINELWLCLQCPKIPIQITFIDYDARFMYRRNFSSYVAIGEDYCDFLQLSPDPEHYGIWIQKADGTLEHNIELRFSSDINNVCFNQERATIVFCVPEKSRLDWNRFKETFLSK